MKILFTKLLFLISLCVNAQHVDSKSFISYPEYKLPNPLVSASGKLITTSKEWEKQREVWLNLYSERFYGQTPTRNVRLRFQVDEVKSDALQGKAIRKQIRIFFPDYPQLLPINMVLYVPKKATSPVPVFVSLNFAGNHGITYETDIPISNRWMPDWIAKNGEVVKNRATDKSRGLQQRRWPLDTILARGYAVATAYYGDIEPDYAQGWKTGIRSVLGDTTQANNWGAIGAWGWGMSRMLDYLETENLVNAKKAIAVGHSRLAKTSLWVGAQDKRFAIVISNNSGTGAAKLFRRKLGTSMESWINDKNRSFWLSENAKYTLGDVDTLPFDGHIFLSLIAPRPVYIGSASEDAAADPEGEYRSAYHAGMVYSLYGLKGLGKLQIPKPEVPIHGDAIGYHMRKGPHDMLLYDWLQYISFSDKYFFKQKKYGHPTSLIQ